MSLVINFLTGAPRAPTPPAVPNPPPDSGGHFGNLLSSLWESESQAGAFLGDATPSLAGDRQAAAKTIADVFNQHGLLGEGAITTMPAAPSPMPNPAEASPAGPDPATSASVPARGVQDGPLAVDLATQPEADAKLPRQSSADFDMISTSRSFDIDPIAAEALPAVVSPHTSAPTTSARLAGQAVVPTLFVGDARAAEGEEVRPERAASNRPAPADEGATSSTQVSVHLAEQGATVVARLIEDRQQERVRLRDRIAALLSRHGLRSQGIRLNGITSPHATDIGREEL